MSVLSPSYYYMCNLYYCLKGMRLFSLFLLKDSTKIQFPPLRCWILCRLHLIIEWSRMNCYSPLVVLESERKRSMISRLSNNLALLWGPHPQLRSFGSVQFVDKSYKYKKQQLLHILYIVKVWVQQWQLLQIKSWLDIYLQLWFDKQFQETHQDHSCNLVLLRLWNILLDYLQIYLFYWGDEGHKCPDSHRNRIENSLSMMAIHQHWSPKTLRLSRKCRFLWRCRQKLW